MMQLRFTESVQISLNTEHSAPAPTLRLTPLPGRMEHRKEIEGAQPLWQRFVSNKIAVGGDPLGLRAPGRGQNTLQLLFV